MFQPYHGPKENPTREQSLPAMVPPPLGLEIVLEQQQQALAAAPPQPQHAAQGQPAEQAEQRRATGRDGLRLLQTQQTSHAEMEAPAPSQHV